MFRIVEKGVSLTRKKSFKICPKSNKKNNILLM